VQTFRKRRAGLSATAGLSCLHYAEDVSLSLERLYYHLFADDMQGFKITPYDVPTIISTLEECAADVCSWCAAKRLQPNAEKTELL